ncbi:MAG: hypothetical protein ACR2JW_10005 [Thermomicrobiales bacterium]
MSTSISTPRPRRQHVAGLIPPKTMALAAKVRASFARLRERFGSVDDATWAFSSQPDHLLAYATWGEMCSDADGGVSDVADRH